MELYKNTPLGAAIVQAMSELNEDLEEALDNASPGCCKAYIFGGAALHLHTNARGSGDIDVEIQAAAKLDTSDILVSYENEAGEQLSVVIDSTFTSASSGMLHEDYDLDAIPLGNNEDAPLHVFVVSAVDLAVHKLDRLVEVDENDIISLAKAGKFTSAELRQRAEEALVYAIGDEGTLRSKIDSMVKELEKLGY